MDSTNLNFIAEQLLLQVKMMKDTSQLQAKLKTCKAETLVKQLENDDKKKAFWINIYNAYYQILKKQAFDKPEIYRRKLFVIANKNFSLDDVEHGILRKYRYKYSLGFFANLFTGKFIKRNSVEILDYRIHFALNCGAKSCPPIAFYKVNNLDAQLDLATQSFLDGESEFDNEQKIVRTTALFKWFYADFGGTKGIKSIFKKQLQKDLSEYKIVYKEYSWEEDLHNFTDV